MLIAAFLRKCLLALAVLIIFLAAMLSTVRILLTMVERYRVDAEQWVSAYLGHPAKIGAMDAVWFGLGPSIVLDRVSILDEQSGQALIHFDKARIDISLLESLRTWHITPSTLTVRGAKLTIIRREDGTLAVEGADAAQPQEVDTSWLQQWLANQERLSFERATIRWRDLQAGGVEHQLESVNLRLLHEDERYQLDVSAELPSSLGRSVRLIADIEGELFESRTWNGRMYARGVMLRPVAWQALRPLDEFYFEDGNVGFALWADWSGGRPVRIEGSVEAENIKGGHRNGSESSLAADANISLDKLQTRVRWEAGAKAWALYADRLNVTRNGKEWPETQLAVSMREDAGATMIEAGYSFLRLEDILPMLTSSGVLDDATLEMLTTLQPQGDLSDGLIRLIRSKAGKSPLLVRTRYTDLSVQPWKKLPAIIGLSGRVVFDRQHGVVELDSGAVSVEFASLFRERLQVASLKGRLTWRDDESALTLTAKHLEAGNADLQASAQLLLEVPHGETAPFLDLSVEYRDGNVASASHYLPVGIMPESVVRWLDGALLGGRVIDGTARVKGYLNEFPFDRGRGQFDVRFNLSDGLLAYAPGWPRLEALTGTVEFSGRGMKAKVTGGRTYASAIESGSVIIPNLTAAPAVLGVQGKIKGPLADGIRYVRESPLQAHFGKFLEGMTAKGGSRLDLRVEKPLADAAARVSADLKFEDSSLSLKDAGVELTQLNGVLGFTEQGMYAKGIKGKLLGQSAVIDVRKETPAKLGKDTGFVVFSARGRSTIDSILERYDLQLQKHFIGEFDWHASLRVPGKLSQRGVEAKLHFESSLQGVEVDLPEPFAKSADAARKLVIDVPLPLKSNTPLSIRYGDLVRAAIAFKHDRQKHVFERGELRFGGRAAVLPSDPGWRLAGELERFVDVEWESVSWQKQAGTAQAAPALASIDIIVDRLVLSGRNFEQVAIRAEKGEQGWKALVDSQQLAGDVQIPQRDGDTLVMNFKRLHLAHSMDTQRQVRQTDPRKVPPISLEAESFRYGSLDLGKLRLRTSRSEGGLRVDVLETVSPEIRAQFTGEWEQSIPKQISTFSGTLESGNFGNTLAALGYANVVNKGKANIDMHLQWRGPPSEFSLERATGKLGLGIKDGSLLDVEPGAGRIFGLLSFQALPRRLTLDFSDLFQKGFSFDRIDGAFALEDGNAYTDNLAMEGPAASIEAKGRVGLRGQDYDQRVTVVPSVISGLPLAGAVAGGVGAAAAIVIAEKLLKPQIDDITRVEYKITGSWKDPVVDRLNKTTAVEPGK